MAFTQITTSNLDNTITTKLAAAEAANAAVANIVSLAISSVQIANSTYAVLDDTAANTGGGYLVINGTGFTNQCVVIVGTTNATSTTFANTKQLRAQVPGLAAATYPLYVVDSATGATAIKVNGLTYSSFPAWSTGSTLANTAANTAFAVSLSASSDSSVTYANTTALPAGTTLAANGYFSGTVTIGAQTTYSFDVRATDAENQDVSRTFSLTVTITPSTRLYTWGQNVGGLLGINNTTNQSSPTQVGTEIGWNMISIGGYNTMVTKTDGTLWTWGKNSSGQLGLNDRVYRSSPTQVGTDTNWSIVSLAAGHSAAIKTDGTLWMWGINNAGQLGLNDRSISRSSPVQVGTATNWSKISTKGLLTAAIKTDGTLWTWGINDNGVLGHNVTGVSGSRSSPTQVGTATNWSQIAIGEYTGMATKTDGTLWMWGNNNYGNNGQSNLVEQSSPTQVGTATNWSQIAAGQYTSFATKTDGTLWAWGANGAGQLGLGNTVPRSSPVQVGTGTNWSKISASRNGGFAIKTDGTLWGWGQNQNGQVGTNNTNYFSSPAQLGTNTNWSEIVGSGSGGFNAIAITTN